MATPQSNVIHPDDYKSIATDYATIRSNLDNSVQYLNYAVTTVVTSDAVDINLDLLRPLNDVALTARSALQSDGMIQDAVRAVHNHILIRARKADGSSYASIEEWLAKNAVDGSGNLVAGSVIKVPAKWASMSTQAGYSITNSLYIA